MRCFNNASAYDERMHEWGEDIVFWTSNAKKTEQLNASIEEAVDGKLGVWRALLVEHFGAARTEEQIQADRKDMTPEIQRALNTFKQEQGLT